MSSTAPSSLPSGRIPELDGIRGIAIAMVLILHFFLQWITFRAGSLFAYTLVPLRLTWSGVDLFFVLSGFLIGGILLDARDSSNYFRVFYTRRFFRIVPIYAVSLGVYFVLYTLVRLGTAANISYVVKNQLPWTPYFFFLQNFWMMHRNIDGGYGLSVMWSLAIEEQFYLTLPVMIWILKPGKRFLTFLGAGILLAPILRVTTRVMMPHSFSRAFLFMMPCRADALLLGVLGAVIVRDAGCRAWIAARKKLCGGILLVLALGYAALDTTFPDNANPVMYSIGLTWLAAFYLGSLLYALSWRESLLARCLRWGWLAWLGSIAYGVYLLHEFFLSTIYGAFWPGIPRISSFANLGVMLVALAATLVFCRMSWIYFEKPLVQLGHRAKYEFAAAPEAPLAALSEGYGLAK